jgi:hypothetical protein
MAVAMKNVVFWDIGSQFVLHRRHFTSPLQRPASYCYVRFEVFMAVTMKNAVFWDIGSQFILHRRHFTSPLQRPAGCYARFKIFTVVPMENSVFWVMTPCGSCSSRLFGVTYRLHHQREKNQRATYNGSSN